MHFLRREGADMKLIIKLLGQELTLFVSPETHEKQMEIDAIYQDAANLTWLLGNDDLAMKIYELAYAAVEAAFTPDFDDMRRSA